MYVESGGGSRQGTCVAASWMRSRIYNELLEGAKTVRVEGGEQGALEWSRFCAGIEDDESNAHYVRILEAVIGALVWDVRGFGDNGQRLERDQVSAFKKLLSVLWRTLLPPPLGLHCLLCLIPSPPHLHPPPLLPAA